MNRLGFSKLTAWRKTKERVLGRRWLEVRLLARQRLGDAAGFCAIEMRDEVEAEDYEAEEGARLVAALTTPRCSGVIGGGVRGRCWQVMAAPMELVDGCSEKQ